MKKIASICSLLILISAVCLSQGTDFTGYTFFINPGHGGHDSNDRHIVATDFWESDGNLEKGLYLKKLLENLKAKVVMSRTTNNTADDLSLSVIDEMANASNADFFLSIHSNGYDGKQNQPLTLFRGYDNQPVFADAKSMAIIIWQNLYANGNCWTSTNQYVKGDWTFYPDWGDKVGLGVLRTLTMPGVLSEGSFHDYISESWRMRNNDYLHHESWAFMRSFLSFYYISPTTQGIIAGIIRDSLQTPTWYFKTGSKDEKKPVNRASVTLMPVNRKYKIDSLNNGFFFFDSLNPGNYKLTVDGLTAYYKDSLLVSVSENKTTLADFYLKTDTSIAPEIISLSPANNSTILVNQEITFTFSLPMNKDSVQKSMLVYPSAMLTYNWSDNDKKLLIKPAGAFQPKTNYSINITTQASSRWKVNMKAEKQYTFITQEQTDLISVNLDGKQGVELFPNPISNNGIIRFALDKESEVSVNIFTSEGEKIWSQFFQHLKPGINELVWVPSPSLSNGVYLVQLTILSNETHSSEFRTAIWMLNR